MLLAVSVEAQMLMADPDFGDNGQIQYDWGFDLVHKVKVQPDQHILIASTGGSANNTDFAITRLKPDGDIDQDFGLSGRVETDLGAFEKATDLMLQPDGRILACGLSSLNSGSIVVARMLADGTPDSTFAINGFRLFSLPGLNITSSLVEMAADNALGVYIAFQAFISGSQKLCILHCSASGNVEPWGNQPLLQLPITGETDGFERCIATDSDGKIWLAYAEFLNNQTIWRVLKLNQDGSAVSGFENISFSPSTFPGTIREIILRPQGGITLCGYAEQGSGTESLIMVQLNADGSLNNTFGLGGVLAGSPGFGLKAVSAIQQSDASFLLCGISGSNGFALRKVSENGQPDLNFGNNGLFYLNAENAESTSLVVAPGDTSLIVGGSEFLALNPDIHIHKFKIKSTPSNIELPLSNQLLFYPNPSNGTLYLFESKRPAIRTIQLYNAQLAHIAEIVCTEETHIINLPEIPTGLYFLHFNTREGQIVTKYMHINANPTYH